MLMPLACHSVACAVWISFLNVLMECEIPNQLWQAVGCGIGHVLFSVQLLLHRALLLDLCLFPLVFVLLPIL